MERERQPELNNLKEQWLSFASTAGKKVIVQVSEIIDANGRNPRPFFINIYDILQQYNKFFGLDPDHDSTLRAMGFSLSSSGYPISANDLGDIINRLRDSRQLKIKKKPLLNTINSLLDQFGLPRISSLNNQGTDRLRAVLTYFQTLYEDGRNKDIYLQLGLRFLPGLRRLIRLKGEQNEADQTPDQPPNYLSQIEAVNDLPVIWFAQPSGQADDPWFFITDTGGFKALEERFLYSRMQIVVETSSRNLETENIVPACFFAFNGTLIPFNAPDNFWNMLGMKDKIVPLLKSLIEERVFLAVSYREEDERRIEDFKRWLTTEHQVDISTILFIKMTNTRAIFNPAAAGRVVNRLKQIIKPQPDQSAAIVVNQLESQIAKALSNKKIKKRLQSIFGLNDDRSLIDAVKGFIEQYFIESSNKKIGLLPWFYAIARPDLDENLIENLFRGVMVVRDLDIPLPLAFQGKTSVVLADSYINLDPAVFKGLTGKTAGA